MIAGDDDRSPGVRHPGLVNFWGPTGANAVDAALNLCKTATGHGDVISFQGDFHGTTHAAMALTGLVVNKASVPLLGVRRSPPGAAVSPNASISPPWAGVDSRRSPRGLLSSTGE